MRVETKDFAIDITLYIAEKIDNLSVVNTTQFCARLRSKNLTLYISIVIVLRGKSLDVALLRKTRSIRVNLNKRSP